MIVAFLFSCNNRREEIAIEPGMIYFDYRVWGDEESAEVNIRCQFWIGGMAGEAGLLPGNATIKLDGIELHPDSTRMSGVYYEVSRPVAEFAGKHTIDYTDSLGKVYREDFEFLPFGLADSLPGVVRRDDLFIRLTGVPDNEVIRLILTDTAAFSRGIVRTDTIQGGTVDFRPGELSTLADGPIYFELGRDEERRLRPGGRHRGRLLVSYSLHREFELR